MVNHIGFPGLGIPTMSIQEYFSVFGFKIHWYGVIIALGIVLAFLFAARMGKKRDVSVDTLLDLILFGLPSAIIGARLYYVIFEWDSFKNNLLDIVKIWEGGLAIYGGIIGACISTVIYCRVKKINLWNVLDVGAFGLLIGQTIGRWGNFVNAEAYGGETTLPWRMELVDLGISVHPTFLYESLWNALVFCLLLWWRKKQKFKGELFLAYLALYGLGRFWIEGLRTDSLYLGGARISQVVAALCFIVGACLIVYFRKKQDHVVVPVGSIFGEEGADDTEDREDAAVSETERLPETQDEIQPDGAADTPQEPADEEENMDDDADTDGGQAGQ